MKTAEADGWASVLWAVFTRDKGCVAVQFELFGNDAAKDSCADRFNNVHPWNDFSRLEGDHVKEGLFAYRKAPDNEAHLQAACGRHHRDFLDSKKAREKSRDRLASLYPEVWDRKADHFGGLPSRRE